MHIPKEDLPVRLEGPGTTLRSTSGSTGGSGWGHMAVSYAELPAGTDLGPLLEGLANNSCHSPHWGYILKGSIHVRYTGGREEVVRAGEVFYLPSGHTAWLDEDSTFVEFSPEKEYGEVLSAVADKSIGIVIYWTWQEHRSTFEH